MNYSIDIVSAALLITVVLSWWPRRVAKDSDELMDRHREFAYLKRYSAYRMNMYIKYKE